MGEDGEKRTYSHGLAWQSLLENETSNDAWLSSPVNAACLLVWAECMYAPTRAPVPLWDCITCCKSGRAAE